MVAASVIARAADKPSERTLATTSTPSTASHKPSARTLPQIEYINDFVLQSWRAHGLQPSASASDGEWCRRVFLDLLGRIPSIHEIERFQKDRAVDRKLNLINRLLSDEYVEEYARNWSNIWTILLIGRPTDNRAANRSPVDREGMSKYLRDTFARNKPYDQMVFDLVTATGSTRPGDEDFNGATNFLIGDLAEQATNATAKTAKLFLGMQVQCTQCHNHPFNDWKQNQFWELNSFFRQTANQGPRRRRPKSPAAELVNVDFAGEGENRTKNIDEAIVFYELRNGQMKSAFPVFVDGQEIAKSGRVGDVNRRNELGRLIINSPYLSQAIVNRMWGHFFGYGFTKPVDDMGPHNPPTHPELLERLASDFTSHSHDLKQLIRWIVLSEPYGLSSKMRKGSNDKDDPSLGEKPMFSHFYLRQMQAEQLYESLMTATEADKTARGNYEEQQRKKDDWLRQFTIAFGTDEGDDTTTFNGTIPQMLMMFNGDMIKAATSIDSGSYLDRIAKNNRLSNGDKINLLYMAALSRKPTAGEIDLANRLLIARKGNPVEALRDVFWVLLNSAEFIFNH
ncbi:MAG: DUF1549 domain-containing protein [Pirellulales bacterium]|nr:DUF1549 domain-containing protein [Pirellulales bacterium]